MNWDCSRAFLLFLTEKFFCSYIETQPIRNFSLHLAVNQYRKYKMRTIQFNIPDTVDLDDREAKMLLASRLYEKGKLTLGQAAQLAGLSKRAFMEILGDYDVSIFNFPVSDLDNDISNARNYSL